jgi:hypothetical protein
MGMYHEIFYLFRDRKPPILVTNFQNIRLHISQVVNLRIHALSPTKLSKN